MNNELEHFHNLVVLALLFEIELYITYYTSIKNSDSDSVDRDILIESIDLLKIEKCALTKTLSGGIRVSLSRNRLIIQDRIYVGFDTEYKTLDSQTNHLLCFTTASTSECLLKIRDNSVDFSLKEGRIHQPKTASLITTGVQLIRLLRGKKDFELETLKSHLDRDVDLTKLVLSNKDIVYKQKAFDEKSLYTSFHDVQLENERYSFYSLLELILDRYKNKKLIINAEKFRLYTRNLRPVYRPECYLMAHFTAADVCLFDDFNEVKNKFSVLNKSFLTLDKTISHDKWKVSLRDTSLLSPAGMSLKSIGALYPALSMSKVELTSHQLNNMDQLYESDKDLFASYAIQDSRIVLWHALQVLNSHYLFSRKYSIPVTLSSLASSFLTKRLVTEDNSDNGYHPKTKNGLISMKDLAKLNTPIGIELSGDLHEYIDYFLGSYHGGRNESYIYGVINGEFHDYDLPGAYPTAMAMLNYPD